ncbi:MAG: hypothetical protein ABIP55_12150 [Tepidisphaeraceae bacterium]
MLRDAVMQAADRPEVREAVARVYAELQQEIDTRRPRCDASGRCCRFEEFGHRLYVTTIELAMFVAELAERDKGQGVNQGSLDGTGCPFQTGGLCGVHAIRPFGCRVFFCDASSDDWQHAQYERFHGRLKRLHEQFDIPYRYLEWRQALGELGLLPSTATSARPNRLSLPQLPL